MREPSSGGRWKGWLATCLMGLAITAAVALAPRNASAARWSQPTLLPLPPSTDFPIPPYEPRPDLVVDNVSLDRGYYVVGTSWTVALTVRNIGDATAASLSVFGRLCRYLEGETELTCADEITLGSGTALDPGETLTRTSGPHSFDTLPLDPSPTYESDGIPGLPDSGVVYLRVEARPGAGIIEADGGNNSALTSAEYPTAPSDPAYDPSADADGDGWVPPADCFDTNPEVHPWHNEIVNDGLDNNCSGGDAPYEPTCTEVIALYHNREAVPCVQAPGTFTDTQRRMEDTDGDGYVVENLYGESDCNDRNAAIHPGAWEWEDGVDNDCDQLIDEGLVVPDWAFASFTLSRGFVSPNYLTGDFASSSYSLPALRYSFEIENQGQSLGEGEEGLIDPLVLVQDLEGRVYASGAAGFIPYTAFPSTPGYVPACDPVGLVAIIPTGGIYGEANLSNNAAAASTPPQLPNANLITDGVFDRDLRFASAPGLSARFGTMDSNSEAVGNCPPLLERAPFVDLPHTYRLRYRVYINGSLVLDILTDDDFTYSVDPDSLRAGDAVCYEVVLDPDNWTFETDEDNNSYVQLLRYRDPIIGPPRFDLIDAYADGPGTCATGSIIAGTAPPSADSSLVSTGPSGVLGGLGGALLFGAIGAAIGLYLPRRWNAARPNALGLVSGLFLGAIAGGWLGYTAVTQLTPRPWVQDAEGMAGAGGERLAPLPSCDELVDGLSIRPEEGTSLRRGDSLVLEFRPASDAGRRPIDGFVVSLQNPSGKTLQMEVRPTGPDGTFRADLVGAVMSMAGQAFFEPGVYQWTLAVGHLAIGDPSTPYVTSCLGSSARTFTLEPAPDRAVPSATASPTTSPTAITTTPVVKPPTPTATPSPDSTGPSIKSVSDSPDPIKAGQPKGCSPTTSTVTAAISDPSGVQSAVVELKGAGTLAMAHGGGNNWSATVGPFASPGTVTYTIRAVDGLGNVTISGSAQLTVLACLP